MILERVVVGALQENCYLLAAGPGTPAVVVDPGDQAEAILAALHEHDLGVGVIVCTHAHGDHIGAVAALQAASGADFLLHPADMPTLALFAGRTPPWQAHPIPACTPTRFIADGERIVCGEVELEVIHVPGHTPGHVALRGHGLVFTGDTLFRLGVGRTDLPGGDWQTELDSIRQRLFTLPDDLVVLPGHGPQSTIGEEREHNPYAGAGLA